MRRRELLKVAGSTIAGVAATKLTLRSAAAFESETVVRDVCVIGGGSSGTYSAVRLRDAGKSVVVVERKSRLGGHAETVQGPQTNNIAIDIGVVVFEDIPLVTNYFSRFNIPLTPLSFAGGTTAYVDYRTGKTVAGYAPPGPAQPGLALGEYLQLLATQYPYLDAGFQLPNPVPADLLLPFGAFVQKYNLGALIQTIFAFGQGIGDLLNDPALYVLKLFSLSVSGTLAGGRFLNPPGGTASLYDAAAAFLGNDVLFDTEVVAVDRNHPKGILVEVVSPNGLRRILCQKLVVAIPPTLDNLAPLDLDGHELGLFSRLRANYYGTALVKLSGIPLGTSVQNIGADTLYNLPPLPGIYSIAATAAPDVYNVKYGSPTWLPDDVVRARIISDIERMKHAGTFPVEFEGFIVFSAHAPFEMMVSSEEIANGFYTQLNALQGRHNTFYTGAAFQANDSSLIWTFTEALIPKITA